MINVLSLGAGVQSTTVLLMSLRGELPLLDAAIFADTQWERRAVYENLDWLKDQCAKSIPVYRVSKGSLRSHAMEGVIRGVKEQGERYTSLPLMVLNRDGSHGKLRRQCTREYKIRPIDKFIRRELLGLEPFAVADAQAVGLWMGISCDEPRRVRISQERWKINIYPLCNLPNQWLARPMTRRACYVWLETHYPERRFPRSACVGCPFHTNVEWREVQASPEDWQDAVEVDRAIRHPEDSRGTSYLHSSCKPLEEIDLRTDIDRGQGLLWNDECTGMCGT